MESAPKIIYKEDSFISFIFEGGKICTFAAHDSKFKDVLDYYKNKEYGKIYNLRAGLEDCFIGYRGMTNEQGDDPFLI